MSTTPTPPDPCGPAAVAALLEQLAASVDRLLQALAADATLPGSAAWEHPPRP